jgi:hypothetical protein
MRTLIVTALLGMARAYVHLTVEVIDPNTAAGDVLALRGEGLGLTWTKGTLLSTSNEDTCSASGPRADCGFVGIGMCVSFLSCASFTFVRIGFLFQDRLSLCPRFLISFPNLLPAQDEASCVARGCCWSPLQPNPSNQPWCFRKSNTSTKWTFDADIAPDEAGKVAEMKALRNDIKWQIGANMRVTLPSLPGNYTVELYPHFDSVVGRYEVTPNIRSPQLGNTRRLFIEHFHSYFASHILCIRAFSIFQ